MGRGHRIGTEDLGMSSEIDDLLQKFESRALSRREVVAALAGIMASAAAAPLAAQASLPTAESRILTSGRGRR